jgi:diacylglycerol kinase family enzyme
VAKEIEIVLNARSGSQRAHEMREVLERILGESGRSFGISIDHGKSILGLAEEKAKSGCELLVAGGGDGTICAAAEAALKHGTTLGVLPLGTFNYFAKNLNIPLELEEAARVLLEGRPIRAPVLDLDGRLVLNNASIGLHPAVLLRRRKIYRRWGRSQLNAYLSVVLTAFQPPPRLRVRLAGDAGGATYETPLVMFCSNGFQMETFGLAGMECLESGKFALYVARPAGRARIFQLGLRVIVRKLRPGIDYEAICASDVTIETLQRRRLRAALDGELERLESPMRVRVAPRELRVLVPRIDEP